MRVRTNPVRIFFHGAGWPLAPFRAEGCLEIREARAPSEVVPLLIWARESSERGRMAAGFLAYEAAAAFGLPVRDGGTSSIPLGWFAAFDPGEAVPPGLDRPANAEIPEPVFDTGRDEYFARIALIRERIAAGDTYQVNFTTRARFDWTGDPMDLFARLCLAHPVPYACAIDAGAWSVASLSPELFLEKRGGGILTIPMKGTRPRGRFPGEDGRTARELTESGKDRAENVMIVDMARNDLGRVCRFGSVEAFDLFRARRFRSVWQMTGSVRGILDARRAGLEEVMAAAFPAASITGAPKRRTMEIIREHEKSPRGVYCAAIGMCLPGGDFVFNVAIRTLAREGPRWTAGAGGGVVWDSEPAAEWAETRGKLGYLRAEIPDFELIETLKLGADGYVWLEEHLDRLEASADYWDFPFVRSAARARLIEYGKTLKAPRAVRLLLDPRGGTSIQDRAILDIPRNVNVRLAENRANVRDPFFFHKTTRRGHYDGELARARGEGYFEALFRNERGHVTEGCATNLFVRRGGRWFTPPVEDGLLAGVWRAWFKNETGASEASMAVGDLVNADALAAGNSVTGAALVNALRDSDGRLLREWANDSIGRDTRFFRPAS